MTDVDKLLDEYAEMKTYVEEQKPAWLFLDAERGTEFSYNQFNYFPDAHYMLAIDDAFESRARQESKPDGGTQTSYFWHNPHTNAVIHEDGVPLQWHGLFSTEEQAEAFMNGYQEQNGVE